MQHGWAAPGGSRTARTKLGFGSQRQKASLLEITSDKRALIPRSVSAHIADSESGAKRI
jgi:hypothetical protein